ncbi:uncharacterized protein L3040_000034 [Drepanopeziza brunnea f. sp. 'multigermtubi']|nr:hypothetical protein L3040_000034 [Drepanopeziza brunnea f. sp. 'multigermtubi']
MCTQTQVYYEACLHHVKDGPPTMHRPPCSAVVTADPHQKIRAYCPTCRQERQAELARMLKEDEDEEDSGPGPLGYGFYGKDDKEQRRRDEEERKRKEEEGKREAERCKEKEKNKKPLFFR